MVSTRGSTRSRRATSHSFASSALGTRLRRSAACRCSPCASSATDLRFSNSTPTRRASRSSRGLSKTASSRMRFAGSGYPRASQPVPGDAVGPASCAHARRQADRRLVIGADGANSFVRNSAGIAATEKSYGQIAVVANFRCERPHANVAYQWFQRGAVLASPCPATTSPWSGRRRARLAKTSPTKSSGPRVACWETYAGHAAPQLCPAPACGRAHGGAPRRPRRRRGARDPPARRSGIEPRLAGCARARARPSGAGAVARPGESACCAVMSVRAPSLYSRWT